MTYTLFARESEMSSEELQEAKRTFSDPVFSFENSLVSIKPDQIVVGRYSVLPFYEWIANEVKLQGSELINSYQQHRYIANFEYYWDVSDLTFKTWFHPSEIPDGQFVVKGITNSRKHDWDTLMFAPDRQSAIRIGCDLRKDSLIGSQDIIYRQYVHLQTFEVGLNGLPFTNEWRIFVFKGTIFAAGYYWSNAERIPVINGSESKGWREFAKKVVDRVGDKCNFYVMDIAKTYSGEWVLVELNDGQMSGLSTIPEALFYSNLKEAIWIGHHDFRYLTEKNYEIVDLDAGNRGTAARGVDSHVVDGVS